MKQKLFNLTLSTLFVAVLAACGSSKSEDMVKPDTNQPEAGQQQPGQNTGNDVTKDDVTKQQEIEAAKKAKYLEEINLGFASLQTAKSRDSEFGTGKDNSDYHRTTPGTDKGLDRTLDTIVVATPVDSKDTTKRYPTYLEDFQFDGDLTKLATNNAGVFADTAAATGIVDGVVTAVKAASNGGNPATAEHYKKGYEKHLATLQAPAATASEKDKAEYALKMATMDLLKDEIAKLEDADVANFEAAMKARNTELAVATGYFDFAGAANDANTSYRVTGKYTNKTGIYFNGGTVNAGANRPNPTRTETDKVGQTTGKTALVYHHDRKDYFNREEVNNETKGTYAEVYGNKTFTYEVNRMAADKNAYDLVNDGGVNAPFQKTSFDEKAGTYTTEPGRLTRVQYGRVTSQIDNIDLKALKKGVNTGEDIHVAAFGGYGDKKTEDHYFVRGTHKTAKLSDLEASGTVVYEGHAVSRGLNNRYNGDPNGTPNAVSSGGAISGNHVRADLDIADKSVKGSVYNVWEKSGKHVVVPLVNFNGAVGDNGNMVGESELAYKPESKGTFHAALYGDKGQELGGKVQSIENGDKEGWVAVFGASRQQHAASSGSFWTAINEGSVKSTSAGSTTGTASGN